MGLKDRLRRRPLVPDDEFSPMPGFRVDYGEDTRYIADAETFALMRQGRAQRTAQEQFFVLDMLADEGRATVLGDGFTVRAEEIARLDDDEATVLGLPPRFTGEVHASVHRWTASQDFRIDLDLQVGAYPVSPERRGPIVRVEGSPYRLTVPLLKTLQALDDHTALPSQERTEAENVRLVARIQAANRLAVGSQDARNRDSNFQLSLGALDRFATVTPAAVGLMVEPQDDGSLIINADLGPGTDPTLLATRWHQLDDYRPVGTDDQQMDQSPTRQPDSAVIRADETLVLLEPDQIAGVQEVRRRPRISAEDVPQFLMAPGSYFDPDLVDVDVRFSVRVAGLGVITPVTFNEASSSGLDWFAKLESVAQPGVLEDAARTLAEHEGIEQSVSDAWGRGESVLAVGEQVVDISERSRVQDALAASRRRLEALDVDETIDSAQSTQALGRQVTVGMHILESFDVAKRLRAQASAARPHPAVDFSRLRRTPFPHQIVGIDWMTGLMQAALAGDQQDPARIQGALLADDMGLGKTFMTLVAVGEALRAQAAAGREPLPVLAVMPVALLENWLEEIAAAFGTAHGPFSDVVVLQGDGLTDYRMRGAARETAASVEDLDDNGMVRSDRIHASLRVGSGWKDARLDRPGVLVLTTYETLRRYQVSLGLVDWGVVVLDEAQATKNPEILATRAAKALKARFKLLATGTPVENSLRDFWSLMDTAQPGLLGRWSEFQESWVRPMKAADGDEHQRMGRALRDLVGPFMLRRVKEDHLTDLPPKHVHEYRRPMPLVQEQAYDDVLAAHRSRVGVKGAALKTLHDLAYVSLHPGLLNGKLDSDPARLADSARTLVTVRTVLDDIRAKGEKAIVFAKTKELQRALALWLSNRYGQLVDVVNGDTAATGPGDTRMRKIRSFEAREGFNVIIMSPLAVGVGLTIVGANHAIHLERHWNPAKEAQATDRVYRIGQQREVHVHYPIALHPSADSFDVNLDRLLRSKVALKDAVVVPREVTGDDLERALGLS
jgi:SNF2-related domain/Helicase conserved C-terminal domain